MPAGSSSTTRPTPACGGGQAARQRDAGGGTNQRYAIKPTGGVCPERSEWGELISQDGSFHHGVHPERSRGDALGSTDRITDASQVEQVAYRYRAFGEQTVVSGSSPNRFTWVGKAGYYRQPDLGNYWLRARVYEDGIARFLSRDPAQDEVNLYRYVRNRPLVMVTRG